MNTFPHEDILDSLVTAVLRLDPAGQVDYLNPAAADLLETSPRHARGKRLEELLPADESLPALARRARDHGEPLALAETSLYCGLPPGRRRLVACDIVPIEDGLQVELQVLDRHQLALQDTGHLQNHAAQRLLFQALAHEIKNPLSGMRGAAQLLATEISDPALREYLDVMLRETGRLRDLVDSLLGPARPPRLAATNIHVVLDHVGRLLAGTARGIAWRRDYDPSLPDLLADPDQLAQVFLNLVGNALEAMEDAGGVLVIRTRIERRYGVSQGPAIRVDVEDTGPGVPPRLADSLFLPLVTSRADGTGLGLPIAQDIVQRHGGMIDWQSERGKTVFSVVLPIQGPRTHTIPDGNTDE